MFRVVLTKEFRKCLLDLRKHGNPGKKAELAARAAQQQAATDGEITILKRTKHGEDRLPNVEKYDIENNQFRLVVQLLDGQKKERAFLFVGDHESADMWIKNHSGYRWVRKPSDNTLEFVQVTEQQAAPQVVTQVNTDVPEAFADLPLLRGLVDDQWVKLKLPPAVEKYARGVTQANWETDGQGVVEHLQAIAGGEIANLFLDLFCHAHGAEWEKLHARLDLAVGVSHVAAPEEVGEAIIAPENGEHFVTWTEDFVNFPEDFSWAEWLLFLHPEQKKLSCQDFAGAARLRGVSGSGKTCVVVHRARYLAKKYGEPVMLVTLTESMRKLLEALVREACGVEQTLIRTSTIARFAEDVVDHLHPHGMRAFTRPTHEQLQMLCAEAVNVVEGQAGFAGSTLSKLDHAELSRFVPEEMSYVRSRLLPSQYRDYLAPKKFTRRGRGAPLREAGRQLCLAAIDHWDAQLRQLHLTDYEHTAQLALALATGDAVSLQAFGTDDHDSEEAVLLSQQLSQSRDWYRALLVDEVQDLSQIEVSLLGHLPARRQPAHSANVDGRRLAALAAQPKRFAECTNGLFLVGDGAQTIYRRGFSLRTAGIGVATRSYVMKKNYRNTQEVLRASFGLIEHYEVADVDEDNVARPTEPDFPKRHGEKPIIVKCHSFFEQVEFVANCVDEILETSLVRDQYEGLSEPTRVPICIIGMNPSAREHIARALEKRRITAAELREDSSLSGPTVKISTIESAKGHEFHTVFLVDLVEGTMPRYGTTDEDLPREAARLYVGMTRACEKLYMTYTSSDKARPSRFLPTIQSHCTEMEYANKGLTPIAG